MKTKATSLLVVFSLITTLCMAQKTITVEAQNSDISNNLDLKAVATVFGQSKDLQEFEQKLNDYDSQISNLDLNKDGQVDYLRVIEKTENGIHVVEIQAVLDKDVYQDVASIVVEKDQNNKPTVQVIGDPYIYGDNYIIEPSYVYTPSIFSFFWGSSYYRWNSPYYYGYYPSYYHHREPCELDLYYSNVYSHVDHNQRYYYTNNIRNESAARMINSVSRNDLAVRHPERSFSNRNENVRNKSDIEFNRGGSNTQTRSAYQGSRSSQGSPSSYQGTPSGNRAVRTLDNSNNNSGNNNNGNRNQSYQNGSRTNSNGNIRTNMDGRNSTSRTYTTPSNVQQNSNPTMYRDQNRSYQSQPTYNPNVQTRSNNSVTRDYNNNSRQAPNNNSYRQAPTVSQPSRESQQSQPRQQVERNTNSSPSPARQAPAPRESSKESRNSDSGRR